MTPTTLLAPTFTQMLGALSSWLVKAEGAMDDADRLLSARLAPDMYTLSGQVRFACVQAYEAAFRLRGEPLGAICETLAAEGRNAEDRPGDMAAAKACIAETVAYLSELDEQALDQGSGRAIVLALPNGMTFDMTGEAYVRDWVLPQFYFHLMAAYAILRSQGVAVGKPDYVGHMFAYLRKDAQPAS